MSEEKRPRSVGPRSVDPFTVYLHSTCLSYLFFVLVFSYSLLRRALNYIALSGLELAL